MLTTLRKFLADFGIFGKLNIVIRFIFHDDGFQVDVVTYFIFGHIDVCFPGQCGGRIQVAANKCMYNVLYIWYKSIV